MKYDALLLCAGLGSRLRPLTEAIPKPLLPVSGFPLLDWNLNKLLAGPPSQNQPRRIVVNSHHLAPLIEQHLWGHPWSDFLTSLFEPEILGTGGAIVNARQFLMSDPFLVLNADTLSETPIDASIDFHRRSGCPATLILSSSSLNTNVVVQNDRVVTILPEPRKNSAFTFTGSYLVSPELISSLPESGFHNIRDTFITLAAAGRLAAFISKPVLPLLDIGTPARYLAAQRFCVQHDTSAYGFNSDSDRMGNESSANSAPLDSSYLAPGVKLHPEARIHNSIVLDGVELGSLALISNSILGPGVVINNRVEGVIGTGDKIRQI